MSSFPLRPATAADAEQIASLFRATYGAARPMEAGEIVAWLETDIEPDDVRVLEVDGRIAGYGDVWLEDECVGIDVAAPGNWDVFLDWAEQRARGAGKPKSRLYCPEGHELAGVATARGYRYWRSSFTMEITLDGPPDVPALGGLQLRPYRGEDAEAVRAALNEAFAGDPLHTDVSANDFTAYYQRQGQDPSLWQLAWDGDELAGFSLVSPHRGIDDALGWIQNLGVRPRWRRRGLASALLRSSFAALYDRGVRRVGLGVDAENATGAVELYERAGMRSVRRLDNWIKDV